MIVVRFFLVCKHKKTIKNTLKDTVFNAKTSNNCKNANYSV